MRTYQVCDIDGFTSDGTEGNVQHYTDNPTHTSHIGIGGDLSVPIPYSSSSLIPQVTTDPVSPVSGQIWVRKLGTTGGEPIGLLLSLTYASTLLYQLSYRTAESTTLRITLI